LLTEIFAVRADKFESYEMLKLYAQNQYAKPAICNAAQYRSLEAEMLLAAEEKGTQCIILSPAALFGCCSVFGAVSQNKVISATRNLEILSDTTNMLALNIVAGIKDGTLSNRKNQNRQYHRCRQGRGAENMRLKTYHCCRFWCLCDGICRLLFVVILFSDEEDGGGFIDYAASRGKKYTFELADRFARDKSGGAK